MAAAAGVMTCALMHQHSKQALSEPYCSGVHLHARVRACLLLSWLLVLSAAVSYSAIFLGDGGGCTLW
jgi:hypothetical protein